MICFIENRKECGTVAAATIFFQATARAGGGAPHRVATHWSFCAVLARRFPSVHVKSSPIFVRDGKISAGVTAGIDLALVMVDGELARFSA